MEPELGRDATVAIVLIAAIVALVTRSIGLGAVVIVGAVLLVGAAVLIRSRIGAPRHSRTTGPRH